MATGLEKVSFHSSPKECSNYCTIALILHVSKVMLKILQARLQQYLNRELPDVQGKEQRLHFPGAAVKRYPTSKIRETQVRW